MVHTEREVDVDVHFGIVPRRARLQASPSALIAATRLIPGSRYRMLVDTDIVLHAMAHLFFSGDLADSVRDLLDIHLLLEHYGAADTAFWSRLTARAAELDFFHWSWPELSE